MKVYWSKVDIWLVIIVFAPFIYAVAQSIKEKNYWITCLLTIIMLLVLSLYWQIKYIIKDNHLIIHAGIFGSTKIPISDIKSVHKTYNPLSAPALSIQTLEVKYGKYDYQLISPQNRMIFLKDLKAINPSIDIKV